MTNQPLRFDVPEDTDAIFSNDGRVFYSLDRLIEEYGPIVANQVKAAEVFKDAESVGAAAGMTLLFEAIKRSNETLSLDAIFDESE